MRVVRVRLVARNQIRRERRQLAKRPPKTNSSSRENSEHVADAAKTGRQRGGQHARDDRWSWSEGEEQRSQTPILACFLLLHHHLAAACPPSPPSSTSSAARRARCSRRSTSRSPPRRSVSRARSRHSPAAAGRRGHRTRVRVRTRARCVLSSPFFIIFLTVNLERCCCHKTAAVIQRQVRVHAAMLRRLFNFSFRFNQLKYKFDQVTAVSLTFVSLS